MMQEKPLSEDGGSHLSAEMASLSRPGSLKEHLPPLTPSQNSSKETYPAFQPTTIAAIETPNAPRDIEDDIPANDVPASPGVPAALSRRLYISHFLSAWNSRSFELGAVLFLASIFPLTLLPLSIYALVRSGSAIILGPIIGRAIDKRDRLQVVRFSIGKLFSPAAETVDREGMLTPSTRCASSCWPSYCYTVLHWLLGSLYL